MSVKLLSFSLVVLLAGLVSCTNDTGSPAGAGFNRTAMLGYYADHHILPAFDSLANNCEALYGAVFTLTTSPTAENLNAARQQWLTTYLSWQSASAFTLGPTGEQGLRRRLSEEVGTFPVSEAKIQQYSAAGDTSFTNFDRDSRGLYAIEYFLWAGGDQVCLSRILQPQQAAYLRAATRRLRDDLRTARTGWQQYRSDFVSSNGTSAGSSTTQLYNEFLLAYEGLKNFKVGLPMGLRVGQTQPEPAKVEAYYSGYSLLGISQQLHALESFWSGNRQAGGPGFKHYLQSVVGGEALVAQTEYQLGIIRQKLEACGTGRLDSLVQLQSPLVLELHTELQRNTRFFKSDMSSLLGLTITFSSGDGD
jgi:uncharacterized protein